MTLGRAMSAVSPVLMFGLALATVIAAVEASPRYWALLPAALCALVGAAAFRHGLCQERLRIDEGARMIHWCLEFSGTVLSRRENWLAVSEIVELHLHRSPEARGAVILSLYALLRDGSRRLLRSERSPASAQVQEEVNGLVERLAILADCTVRMMDSRLPPTPPEIAEAIRQRRLADPAPATSTALLTALDAVVVPPPGGIEEAAPQPERREIPREQAS